MPYQFCFWKRKNPSLRVSSVLAPSLAAVLPRLEAEWAKLQSPEDEGRGISAAGLLEAWRRADGARWRQDDADLIAVELERIFSMLDSNGDGRVSLSEFRHFVMLKASLPLQVQYLVDLVQHRAKADKKLVERLVGDFTAADKAMKGKIPLAEFEKILARRSQAPMRLEALGVTDEVSYPEYLGLMLGRKPEKVTLLFYDISGKTTKVFGRLLFGKKIEGIWHTSILAFDREWWYGGDLFRSTPYKTPFGQPVKQIELGKTYFTSQEVFKHITEHLHLKFNQKTYDVFENNCNNFTDTLSVFLCGRKLPQDVLDLPKDLMAGGLARLFRRPLNRWLGGFGGADQADEEALEVVLKSLAEDRKLFRWRDRTVEVIKTHAGGKVDLRYLQRGDFVEVKDVAVAELGEIEDMVDQDFLYLAMEAIDDTSLRKEVGESMNLHFKKTSIRQAACQEADKVVSSDMFRVLFRDPADDKRKRTVSKTCC